MKICKFGGSSMASANQIKKAASIILADVNRKIIVVSAPGKRFPSDIKITDLLIKLANRALNFTDYKKIYDTILLRYYEIANELNLTADIIKIINDDLLSRLNKPLSEPLKFIDSIKSSGEDACAKLFNAYLNSIGVKSQYLNPHSIGLFLTDQPGNARIIPSSYQNLSALKNVEGIAVIPGFFGYTLSGDIVTFGRGGSDITGSIIAAAVEAELYENFTDVDNVFVADPNIIVNPKPISEITYREMRELAYAGFNVLHEEALEPIYRKSIPIVIKNTNNPGTQGTIVLPKYESDKGSLTGIAGQKGFVSINLSKYMMNREVGFGRKVFQILEDENISFDHTPSGIDNISIIIDKKQLTQEVEDVLIRRFYNELEVETISIDKQLAIIMVVGEQIIHENLCAKATNALYRNHIGVKIMSQSPLGISLMIGIDEGYFNHALITLYNEFYLSD